MLYLFHIIPVYVILYFPRHSIMKPILVISNMSPICSRVCRCVCICDASQTY